MSVRARIRLAAASATLIGTVVTAVLIGAFISNRQGYTLVFATLCGICVAVTIATSLFVHFHSRSASRQITELTQSVRAELREAGLIAIADNEGNGSIGDLGSMVASITAALKRKSDRIFYLENKVKHMTAHTHAPDADSLENCGGTARRARHVCRLHRRRGAEQNKRAREKTPSQPFSSTDFFDASD